MNKDEYTENLENIIKQMLAPLRKVPFGLVVDSLANHKIISFDKNDVKDIAVLQKLSEIAVLAGQEVNKSGIFRPRPNEVGNDIEAYVKDALISVGYKADTPKTKSGKKKSTGYPDIEFVDEFGRLNYLECKTFNINNLKTTQRSFFVSPSENFKITADAHHFMISYEVYVDGRDGNNNIYKCGSWKILSIENLEVDVKYEFNSDNARLYADEMILAEGNLR